MSLYAYCRASLSKTRAVDLAPDRSQPGAPAAHSCQLVGPGIFTVLSGLCAIVRGNLAVAAGLCAVGRGLTARRGSPGTFVCRMLTVARRAMLFSSVEITRRVVMRVGLYVTQFGLYVTLLRGQIAFAPVDVAPVDVTLARSRKGVSVCPRGPAVLIWASHAMAHVRPSHEGLSAQA
jgi:hypothetical protein